MVVFLTGATGLAGAHAAAAAARRGHKVTAIGWQKNRPPEGAAVFQQIDLRDPNHLTRAVFDAFPDVIINAAAVTDAADCDRDPGGAEMLNTRMPARLAELAHHLGARLIHLSTDMVFDGQRGNYSPSDPVRPTSFYGRLKLRAEEEVLRRSHGTAVILRPPLLTGNSPSGLRSVHEKLFSSWARGEIPALFTDEWRQPCLAANLAEVLVELAERDDLNGIHHWAGAEVVSRFQIGERILQYFQLPLDLIRESRMGGDPAWVDRPKNLSLDISSLAGKLKTRPLGFSAQLASLQIPPPFRDWYNGL